MTPRLDILPPQQRDLWPRLSIVPPKFVLYGGTALALRLGHRRSVDFDFFAADPFDPADLIRRLGVLDLTPLRLEANTLEVRAAQEVRVSFFGGLRHAEVAPPDPAGPVRIASIDDIFATKLAAVFQRSESKDYIDIDAILQTGRSLAHGLACARAVHGLTFNPAIALKAVAYHDDVSGPLSREVQERLKAAAAEVRDLPSVSPHSGRIGGTMT